MEYQSIGVGVNCSKELEQLKHSSTKIQDVISLQLLGKMKSNMSDYRQTLEDIFIYIIYTRAPRVIFLCINPARQGLGFFWQPMIGGWGGGGGGFDSIDSILFFDIKGTKQQKIFFQNGYHFLMMSSKKMANRDFL